MSCFFKKLDNVKRLKKRLCQLTSVVLCSPFWISSLLQMELIGCLKTVVRNYPSMLCNIPEECRSPLTICQCMLLFGSTRFSSERSGSAPHTRIYGNLTYIGAKFKRKTLSCIQVNTVYSINERSMTTQHSSNDTDRRKLKHLEKNLFIATIHHISHTDWPGIKPEPHGKMLATNCLSHDT